MKKLIISLFTLSVLFSGCDLDEDPPFLSEYDIYNDADNIRAALDAVYAGMVSYNNYGARHQFVSGLYSGYMVTRRGGQGLQSPDNALLASLTPTSGDGYSEGLWFGTYTVIARANNIIQNAAPVDTLSAPDPSDQMPENEDLLIINDVIGQAYFIRAFSYYNLIGLWGEVPLRLVPATSEDISLAKSSKVEIYGQIIRDCQQALKYMNGVAGDHYPKTYAANMLLAKVYMLMATDEVKIDETANYWQLAYDEAIKIKDKYKLIGSYENLFIDPTSDNNSESIFELQMSQSIENFLARDYGPRRYINGVSFGWLKVNADFYQLHFDQYPGDPRLTATYIYTYDGRPGGNAYPLNKKRDVFDNAHPTLFKFAIKNRNSTINFTNQNVVVFRYAELLLMLAEISNELNNGEQLGYVTEVLDRVGQTPPSAYSGNQEEFRAAIMREYQFELLGEGNDAINVRRRGYDWFKANIIDLHNNNPLFSSVVDVKLAEGEEVVMKLPIPSAEINSNSKIN